MASDVDQLLANRSAFGCLDVDDENQVLLYRDFLSLLIRRDEEAYASRNLRYNPPLGRQSADDRGDSSQELDQQVGFAAYRVLTEVPSAIKDGLLMVEALRYIFGIYHTLTPQEAQNVLDVLRENGMLAPLGVHSQMLTDRIMAGEATQGG